MDFDIDYSFFHSLLLLSNLINIIALFFRHIKDDFEHLFTQSELDEMEHDRVAFTWYT